MRLPCPAHKLLLSPAQVRLWQALCTLSPLVPEEQVEAGAVCQSCRTDLTQPTALAHWQRKGCMRTRLLARQRRATPQHLLGRACCSAAAVSLLFCRPADFGALLAALDKPELSTVRQYIDTAALVLLRRRPALLRSSVLPALRDCSTSGTHALSSLLIIAARELVRRLQPAGAALPGRGGGGGGAVHDAQTGSGGQLASLPVEQQQSLQGPTVDGEADDEELLGEVLGAIAPWALSHVHALRCAPAAVLPAAGWPLCRACACRSAWSDGSFKCPASDHATLVL